MHEDSHWEAVIDEVRIDFRFSVPVSIPKSFILTTSLLVLSGFGVFIYYLSPSLLPGQTAKANKVTKYFQASAQCASGACLIESLLHRHLSSIISGNYSYATHVSAIRASSARGVHGRKQITVRLFANYSRFYLKIMVNDPESEMDLY